MENQQNNKKFVQWYVFVWIIGIIIVIFGWQIYRIEKVEDRTENYIAQSVEKYNEILAKYGEINTGQALILQRLEWLEKIQEQYKKANGGKLNLEDFFEDLFSKDSSLK